VDCRIVYVRGTYYCFEQQEFCDAFFLRFFFFFFFKSGVQFVDSLLVFSIVCIFATVFLRIYTYV
jgi:hypothetical protein